GILQRHRQAALQQCGEQQSGGGSQGAQNHSIGEKLLRQAPDARAQRNANGYLAAANQELRQQQVDHVGAGDQQQEQPRSRQLQKRSAIAAAKRFPERSEERRVGK